jgi:hypothetical protein
LAWVREAFTAGRHRSRARAAALVNAARRRPTTPGDGRRAAALRVR